MGYSWDAVRPGTLTAQQIWRTGVGMGTCARTLMPRPIRSEAGYGTCQARRRQVVTRTLTGRSDVGLAVRSTSDICPLHPVKDWVDFS